MRLGTLAATFSKVTNSTFSILEVSKRAGGGAGGVWGWAFVISFRISEAKGGRNGAGKLLPGQQFLTALLRSAEPSYEGRSGTVDGGRWAGGRSYGEDAEETEKGLPRMARIDAERIRHNQGEFGFFT